MARTFLTDIALPRDPQSPLQAATKQYVDTGVATRLSATDNRALTDPVATHAPALTQWRTALGARATSPADVLVIGDSISEGMGASTLANRWIEQLQTLLRGTYPVSGVAGGDGYRPGQYISTSFTNGWSYSGAISGDGTFGLAHRGVVLASPDGSLSRTVSGTSVTIAYSVNSGFGSFSVFVDGSSTASVTINTATGATTTTHDGGRTTITFGARGSHTVRIAWAAGGSVYLNGLFVRDQDENAGVRVTDSAQHGSSSANWSTGTNSNAYTLSDDITALQPDLVIIELGANDMIQGLSSANYKTNLTTIISQVRAACTTAPSIVLVAAYQLAATYTEPWQNYVDQMRAVATTDTGVSLCDLSLQMPTAAVATYGFIYSDGIHPSDAGHAYIAQKVAAFLAPTMAYALDGTTPVAGQSPVWSPARGAYVPGYDLTRVKVTGAYTANPGEYVEADATSGAFTVTLAGTGLSAIKKVDTSTNQVTVAAPAGMTIGSMGAASFPLRLPDQSLVCLPSGSNLAIPYGYQSLTSLDGRYTQQARQIGAGIGLTGGGDLTADRSLAVSYGTAAGTAAQGNDVRLSDARTPTAGSVVDASVAASANIAETKLNLATDAVAATGSRRTLGSGAQQAAAGNHTHVAGRSVTTSGPIYPGETIFANAASGALTLTPNTTGIVAGNRIWVEKTDTSTNPVIFSATVNGDTAGAQLLFPNLGVGFVWTGTAWTIDTVNTGALAPTLTLNTTVAGPSAAGSRTGSYDPRSTVYQPTTVAMRSIRAQLSRAATGSLVDMVALGDSKTAGINVGATAAWPAMSRALFAGAGIPSAGTGCVMCANRATDTRITYTGTWNQVPPFVYAAASGAKITFASTPDTGTVVEVYYYSNSGNFTVAVDGGTAVAVTPSGAQAIAKYTVTGLSNIAHSVVVTTTSASNTYFIGFCVRQTSGLLVHSVAIGGFTSSGLLDTTFSNLQAIATFINPSICGLEIGINDPSAGLTAAQTGANIGTIMGTNNAAAPAKFLMTQLAAPTTNQTQWAPWVSATYDRADALNIPLLDLNDRQGVPSDAQTAGLIGSDLIHETAAGQLDVARGVVGMLAR